MQKKTSGFASAVIMIVVIAIIIAGGIAAVHFFPRRNSSATSQPASAQAPATSTPSLPAPATSVVATACTNFDCLIAAAQTCSPITAEVTQTTHLYDGIMLNALEKAEIKGSSGGSCLYDFTLKDASATIDQRIFNDPTFQNQAIDSLKSSGASDAEIQAFKTSLQDGTFAQEVQSGIEEIDASVKGSIGSVTNCTIPSAQLVQRLTNQKTTDFNAIVNDPYCKTAPAGSTPSASPEAASPVPQSPAVSPTPATWQSYSDSHYHFTISHPEGSSISSNYPGGVMISFPTSAYSDLDILAFDVDVCDASAGGKCYGGFPGAQTSDLSFTFNGTDYQGTEYKDNLHDDIEIPINNNLWLDGIFVLTGNPTDASAEADMRNELLESLRTFSLNNP